MNRLIAANSVAFALRDTAPGVGTPQYATDGDPNIPRAATIWPAYFANMLMDEFVAVVEAAGLTPSSTDWTQLFQAFLRAATFADTSGAANTITINPPVAVPAGAIGFGLGFTFQAVNTNTSATVNLNLSATGNVRVKKADGSDPGVGDIIAGRFYHVTHDGTNYRLVVPISAAAGSAGQGQCQLVFINSTTLRLQTYNGRGLTIDGEIQAIPSTGVNLANTGLTAATFYYVYAYMSGATMTLEASATGWTTDANGIAVKTGDGSRTLVGACYTDAGTPGTFRFDITHLWVMSWFNRRYLNGVANFSTDRSTGSATYAEINSEIRVSFISWADEQVNFYVSGECTNTVSANGVLTGVAFDGTAGEPSGAGGNPAAANSYISAALAGVKVGLAENAVHYATVVGEVTSGTGLWLSFVGNDAGVVLHIAARI